MQPFRPYFTSTTLKVCKFAGLCLIVLCAVNAVIQNPQPDLFSPQNEMYSVHIGGVVYWSGTFFPDGILSNGTSLLNYPENMVDGMANASNVKFTPSHVNFSQQEMGIPAYAVVTITNTSPNQSLHLISIRTSSFTLLFKPINVAVLEPGQATPITLLLVASRLGHIEAELYAATSSGLARCKIYGFSTASKYGLRPLKSKRLSPSSRHRFTFTLTNPHPFPIEVSNLTLRASSDVLHNENQLLLLSTETSLQLQKNANLKHIPNSTTLAGQQRSEFYSLTFSNPVSKTLKGLVLGVISLVNASESDPAVPRNYSSNLLLRHFSLEPLVFLLPLEMHFATSNLFGVQKDVHDFDCLTHPGHPSPPRPQHYTAFNHLPASSALNANTMSARNSQLESHHPMWFADGSTYEKEIKFNCIDPDVETDELPAVTVLDTAPLQQGSLQFNYQRLSFYCGDSDRFVESRHDLVLTNTFDFPLEIWGYRLPEAYADMFEISGLAEAKYILPGTFQKISVIFRGLDQRAAFHCKVDLFNLTFYTNASSFYILLDLYDAKVQILSPSGENAGDALTFDVFDTGGQHTLDFYISNPNPVAITLLRIRVGMPASSQCVSLAQLQQHTDIYCHHHSEVEIRPVTEANCISQLLVLQPSNWIHFASNFTRQTGESTAQLTLTVETLLASTSKLVRVRFSIGALIMEPPVFDLGSVFSGKPISRSLMVHSSLSRPVEVTAIEVHSVLGLPNFQVSFSHSPEVASVSLKPNRTLLMGSVSFNASLWCTEIFATHATSTTDADAAAGVCYTGFELSSPEGRDWFASNFFAFSKNEGLSTLISEAGFISGLRFSARVFVHLQSAWRLLTRRMHDLTVGVPPPTAKLVTECRVFGRLTFRSPDIKEALSLGRLVANFVWPRILSEKVTTEEAIANPSSSSSSLCLLNFNFGHTEGLAQLRIQNLVTEPVTCHLSLVNPTEHPLVIQPLLLDDLLPSSMNYTELVKQFAAFSSEMFRAANVPADLVRPPQHPAQRIGRFTSRLQSTAFDNVSLAYLRSLLHDRGLKDAISPTCCPVYVLSPRGGTVKYSITFEPGAFHSESIGHNHRKFDLSLLLLRNNLTALEAVLLKTFTKTALVGVRSGLLLIDHPSSRAAEGDEHSFNVFPTATGLAFDAAVNYNPALANRACESTPLGGNVEIARYDLRSESTRTLCPVAAVNDTTLLLYKVSPMLLNISAPDGALFSFTFHEGHLRSLCTDGAIRPRPSITRFLKSVKSVFPFNLFYFSSKSPASSSSSASDVESSHSASPLQLAWAMDDDGVPIFSSEFISGLALSRRIALFNPGSLPVWIMRVGFKQLGDVEHASAPGQCDPYLLGFSVSLCDNDGTVSPIRSRDGALREFELKPGEQRWLEVSYSPDFLHTETTVGLCLFASLRAPTTGRPVWLSKRMMDLKPVKSSFKSFLPSSSLVRNTSGVNEFSIFQLDSIRLNAKMSSSLTRLCYNSLIRPAFEDNLWSLLLFVFASNFVGIFVAAFFDAIRLLSFHENYRQIPQPTAAAASAAHTNSGTDRSSSSQLFNLNFDPPLFGQEQLAASLSARVLMAAATDDETSCRRRVHRLSASEAADWHKNVTDSMAQSVVKSLAHGLRTTAVGTSRTAYRLVVCSLSILVKRCRSVISSLRGQTAEVGRANRAAYRKITKSAVEASFVLRNQQQQQQDQNRRDETETTDFSSEHKSLEEVKRTSKQLTVKANGEPSPSLMWNSPQASCDSGGVAIWTNQTNVGGYSKVRGSAGAKQSLLGAGAAEFQAPLKQVATASKKHYPLNFVTASASTTIPASPKMRTVKSSGVSAALPTPPTPPPPSLVMESIKVESASMGVKKPKQFGHHQQPSSKVAPTAAALLPQPQGSCKPLGQRYSSVKEANVAKQKLLPSSSNSAPAPESSAQRKKPSKTTASIQSPHIAFAGVAAAFSPCQTRKLTTYADPLQTSEQWRQSSSIPTFNPVAGETGCGSSGQITQREPSATAWTGASLDSCPKKNHLGDFEFPPLGSTVLRRPAKTTTMDDNDLSQLFSDTSEFDCLMRSLPPNSHRVPGTAHWHDATPLKQQEHAFSPRYCPPSTALTLLSPPRGQFSTPVPHLHCPRPSLPLTTMIYPSSPPYCYSSNATSINPQFTSHDYTYYQDLCEPVVSSAAGNYFYYTDSCGHRRRRSSTGQILTSTGRPEVNIADSAVATDSQELTDSMFFLKHKSAAMMSPSMPLKMDGVVVEQRSFPPEWLNAFNTSPSPSFETAASAASVQRSNAPPCELEQLTATRRRWMLKHEQRGQVLSEETAFGFDNIDLPMLDCEYLISPPPNDGPLAVDSQLEDAYLWKEKVYDTFDKTVGGQLTSGAACATEETRHTPSKPSQALPDAFGIFQKKWLPALLPWRSRLSSDNPTRDPNFAATTIFPPSYHSGIPGPIVREVTEAAPANDENCMNAEDLSDVTRQQCEVDAGQMPSCHVVSDDD